MKEVLKFDIKSNGFFSAIPYICFWLMINIAGWTADCMRRNGWATKNVRKICYIAGTLVPGIFLIGTGFVTCENPYLAVAILAVAVGFSGCQYASVMVNHVDIAPPFCGILFGISNSFATLPGFLSPYVIGIITKDGTQEQWQQVFYISGAIYTFGMIFYCLFAEGEVQEWVKPYMEGKNKTPLMDMDVRSDSEEQEKEDQLMNNDDHVSKV